MRRIFAALAALTLTVSLAVTTTPAAATAPTGRAALTNLAHLDFLTQSVRPPAQARHTTYRLEREPAIGMLWVYADRNADGSYRRVGGGDYDAATDTYGQGAYDADDVARAAVVYLRHWKQFGDGHSREQAYQQLRGLTYLQTASGPNAGNVVLWMQPDGTLTPSATPKELPDPSDSANSYWLARTLWALGEGYAAFRHADPAFATFLRQRLALGVAALQRDTLARYGRYQNVDGARTPAWLIVDGADASAEAVLGLSAAVAAGVGEARTALRRLAVGIAAQGTRPGPAWPYGAILPSATSRSTWHSWASLMPAALVGSARALGDRRLLRPAVADAASFTPGLLTSEGPINGLTPAPTDRTQIAYGADSRLQSVLAVATATRSSGLRAVAAVAGAWYFGLNPSGAPMYDRATGVTYDGVAFDGTINQNSGAESTIHGLLSMLALDADPDLARLAAASRREISRDATTVLEAENAQVQGAASAQAADPASSAESAWSGGRLLAVTGTARAILSFAAADRPRVVELVVDRVPVRAGVVSVSTGGRSLGRVTVGGGGAQGVSAVPGALAPVPVGTIPAGAMSITLDVTGGPARIDAAVLTSQPAVLRTSGLTVVTNRSERSAVVTVDGIDGRVARRYDATGACLGRTRVTHGRVPVVAGGFTIVPGD